MNLQDANHLKIGELPDLKIIPVDQIVFHEEPDTERSSSLEVFLQKEGKIKNPPIVAYYNDHNRSILLDGANRITALKNLGVKDVIVQRIDLFDPELIFLNWHHAIEKLSKDSFLKKIQRIDGLQIKNVERNESNNFDDHGLCKIAFRDGSLYHIESGSDLITKIDHLNKLTAIYHGFDFMDRVSYTNLEHLKQNYAEFCSVVSFRKISKEDLIRIIENGSKLPSGVTRIILPKRALRLNVPLDILRFEAPIEEKNHWLQKRINMQVKDKSIRFYFEPTFLFDE